MTITSCSWHQKHGSLAETPVSRIQEILTAAGSRYQLADPGTWPTIRNG
ncbi:MAG: hypothetical protein IPO92_07290 [Saprospiraceae bacterium]|nr:hypothetical protein [Saprospiraceae bacterium]